MQNQNEINFFAKTNFRNQQVPFGIKLDDRRRHMYIIGKTGMGKTSMMENMVVQDIRNGHGVCFIDPHGDSIQKILDYIPNDRINDVVYFNPADLEHPIAFNILEAVESRYKHLVASGLMGVFTKIWANMWSSRMEYILNNTILALLDSPGNTMLGIVRMYVDKKYRKRIIDNIKDPMVKSFWVEEFANYAEKFRTEAVAPIQNKVGQFLSSSVIRNIVGQPKSTLDLRDIMDNRKILLMDLSKGKVGEDNSALLGAMIITKLQLAALSRVDIAEADRKDFFLYVDEFQNFVTDSFATILSEARKYRLNLTMGHQYIGQLSQENNHKVRDAVFGNVGSMVVFRVGAADAEFLETEFDPHFTPTDIVNIPKFNIILKLMINGVASDPFSAVTIPLNEDWVTGNGEKVIKVSRERYANPKNVVEDKIARWMGADFYEASAADANLTASAEERNEVQTSPARNESPSKFRNEETSDRPAIAKSGDGQEKRIDDDANIEKPSIKISTEYIEKIQAVKSPSPMKPKFGKPTAPETTETSKPAQKTTPTKTQESKPSMVAAKGVHGSQELRSKQKNKPKKKSKPKTHNAIWDTAHQTSLSKSENFADKVAGAVMSSFDNQPPSQQLQSSDKVTIPASKTKKAEQRTETSSADQNPANVLKPGQVQKF